MARTKKAKHGYAGRARQVREQQEPLQQTRTSAFIMTNGGTVWEITAANKSVDESMDLDESGGVTIDQSKPEAKPVHIDENATDENDESGIKAWYHQTPIETLTQTGDLWQQPRPYSRRRRAATGNNIQFIVPALYNQCCRLISGYWNCDFDHYVPGELRKQTPYSLALLTYLRVLASKTKNRHSLAHAEMLRVWQDRINKFQNPNPMQPYQFAKTHPRLDEECESSIQENVYGLMIEDVQNVLSRLKNHKDTTRPQRKDRLGSQGRTLEELVEGMSVERRVKKSRVEKRGARAAAQQKCRRQRMEEKERNRLALYEPPGKPQGIAIAPPNSPVMQPSNKFAALSDHFTISTRTASQLTMPPDLPHTEATEELSPQDKENYESMARLLMKMGVKHSKQPLGKKRLKKIAAGGLSRRGAPISLPSEKTDLANTSALPAPESNSVPGGIAPTDQMSLEDIPD